MIAASAELIAFLLPLLDMGIVQSPMLHPATTLSKLLLVGLGWLTVLALAVALTYRRATRPRSCHAEPVAYQLGA